MSRTNRVFVTGMSALASNGSTLDESWAAILAGESGLDEIKQWDLSSWPHRLGGELKNFQPAKMLPDRKLLKVISRQDAMGIHAAHQAVEHSGISSYRDTLETVEQFNDETAVFVGSPGNKYYQQYDFLPLIAKTDGQMQPFAEALFSEVHPMWLLRILPNNVLAYTGIHYGFKGPNHNVANHAVGGMQALIEAYHAIRQGQAKRAVVVAYDVGTEPQALFYYHQLGVISARHLKPFDAAHDGTILAEGAAALVLESEESVEARQATCFAEMVGGLSTTEQSGLFSIEQDGRSLAQLLTLMLTRHQLNPSEIGLVVAHGNGNPKSDISEAQAIRTAFQTDAVPVTALKWSMGHTLCASGLMDTALAVYALRDRCIPGIPGFNGPAPGCAGIQVSGVHRELAQNQSHVMVINRGFAGMNACVVLKACV